MDDLADHAVDLRRRERPGFTVSADLCTWDLVILRVQGEDGGPPVFVLKQAGDVRAFLDDLDAGRRDGDLLTALGHPPRRRLRRPPRRALPPRVGVEHEYVVRGPSGVVDFREVVDTLDLGVRADPSDPHAQRCPWGGVVTADGAEAEVATPPVAIGPGAVGTVVALAGLGRASLEERLGAGFALSGFSTHLNVSAPRRGDRALALRFAAVFAPSLMLLLDRPDSPGLLVRPRPGRLELGGEFADGPDLAVALTFALGAVRASARMGWRTERRLAVELGLERAVERYGWFVARDAPGHDLYTGGRATPLVPRVPGPGRSAGEHLALTWREARRHLEAVLAEAELAAVDRVVDGGSPLPRPQGAAS